MDVREPAFPDTHASAAYPYDTSPSAGAKDGSSRSAAILVAASPAAPVTRGGRTDVHQHEHRDQELAEMVQHDNLPGASGATCGSARRVGIVAFCLAAIKHERASMT
jgi:hypothetical protein